jgi:hypothetical protein
VTLAHPPGIQVAALPVGADGPRCVCVRRHVPMPAEEEIHHIVPTGAPFHGPYASSNTVPLCPTQHSSVHRLLRIYLKAREEGRGARPEEVAHFAPYTRRLARVALDHLDAKETTP